MKGIVLISHGSFAKGTYETSQWFMGKDIPQYTYVGLVEGEEMSSFDERLEDALNEVDTGEGAIILCDMFGGSPCNRAILKASEKVEVISGMNLTMVLELLGNRLSDNYDFDALVETGRNGIVDINKEFTS